ncbi:hypothetical protein [Roseovarius amoyensis]|uniref:hypothetical protein n=1 Tax=Roseovarius amoyensis TaxID=2211448 RepID=UPI000DBE6E7A|nr:hypothetical protein [Roseovarius amoyensis]
MSGLGASAALAVLSGWVAFALAGWIAPPGLSAGLGALAGAGVVLAFRDSVAVGGAIALLAPFGVMLPALALRHVAVRLGVPMPGFATWELVAFLVLYTGFLAAAFGVIPVDAYRLGYAPLPVAVMVLVLCAYGFVTGNWFIPLIAVLGQAAWVIGWGSSNWFDHVLHVVMWPLTVVVLVARLF